MTPPSPTSTTTSWDTNYNCGTPCITTTTATIVTTTSTTTSSTTSTSTTSTSTTPTVTLLDSEQTQSSLMPLHSNSTEKNTKDDDDLPCSYYFLAICILVAVVSCAIIMLGGWLLCSTKNKCKRRSIEFQETI